jgi:hypothetical protein
MTIPFLFNEEFLLWFRAKTEASWEKVPVTPLTLIPNRRTTGESGIQIGAAPDSLSRYQTGRSMPLKNSGRSAFHPITAYFSNGFTRQIDRDLKSFLVKRKLVYVITGKKDQPLSSGRMSIFWEDLSSMPSITLSFGARSGEQCLAQKKTRASVSNQSLLRLPG